MYGFITADAGEDGVAAPTLSPTPPGRFRRTFSFRRRERQDSQSSGATAKESTPAKVLYIYYILTINFPVCICDMKTCMCECIILSHLITKTTLL